MKNLLIILSLSILLTAPLLLSACAANPQVSSTLPATLPITVSTALPATLDGLLQATALPSSQETPTPAASGSLEVTQADSGKTITLRTGERFVLKLGEDYKWTVSVDDPAVLIRVVNITTVRGAQGVYEAQKPGKTTLSATGDPLCRQAQPPCAAPSVLFQIEITVE